MKPDKPHIYFSGGRWFVVRHVVNDGIKEKANWNMAVTFVDWLNKEEKPHPPFVTVTSGMRGYFPVLMVWDKDIDSYDRYNTGDTCKTFDECVQAAKEWAQADGVEYR